MHCRTRENAATYPLQRLQARTRSPWLTQNSIGLRRPRFPTTSVSFLYQSTQHFDIGHARSENIVQILVATSTLPALLPRSFYFQSILRDRLNLRLADPQVYDFPFSILSIIPLLNHIGCRGNLAWMNHFCTQYALFACSFKYCHLLELCKTCCPLSDIHFVVVHQG